MNTHLLKRFAREARRKLIDSVSARLGWALEADSTLMREKPETMAQLHFELSRNTREQLIEKTAYTWFNRLIAIRFLDANDYQPSGIRIITPIEGYTTPEIITEAKRGNIPVELKLDRQRVFDLLENKITTGNPLNEGFRLLLIASCNYLATVFPFLFEKIDDYTELLMPDDVISEFSVTRLIEEGMPVSDCKNPEIIGWLYQFYVSEKKDEVFASKAKVAAADIPAATQLFTPRWIVEYLVQNTLGKLWLQNHPRSELRKVMPYFIESGALQEEDYLKVTSPEDIRFTDPACGSGHILIYAFELFTRIYEEEGYSQADIPRLILEKNLCGFEIDGRAAQLSALALMIRARGYQRRVFSKGIVPNIICFGDLPLDRAGIRSFLDETGLKIPETLVHDLALMQQASHFGSLIRPQTPATAIHTALLAVAGLNVFNVVNDLNDLNTTTPSIYTSQTAAGIHAALSQLFLLAQPYHCVVTNPPYMGSGNMNPEMAAFVKKHYPGSKSDLMACFMESGLSMLHPRGFLGMINQHSWMFLSSYEELRKKLIKTVLIDTLLHLGPRTFPEIGGEVVQNASFVLVKGASGKKGSYIRLVDFENSEMKRVKTLEAAANPDCGWRFEADQKDFGKIPGEPVGYWISISGFNSFERFSKLSDICDTKVGLQSSDKIRFLRLWFEVENTKCSIFINSYKKKWFPFF